MLHLELLRFYRYGDIEPGKKHSGFIVPALSVVAANLYKCDLGALVGLRDRRNHSFYVDCMVVLTVVLAVVFLSLPVSVGKAFFAPYFALRILVLMTQTTVNGLLPKVKKRIREDQLVHSKDDQKSYEGAHSIERMVTLALVNYVEVGLLFANFYRDWPAILVNGERTTDPISCLYFSFITQFTIGYGDIQPVEWARIGVICQSGFGLFILAALVARYVSSLKD